MRQVYWGWKFVSTTVLVVLVFVLLGMEILRGRNVGVNAAILACFAVGYVVVVLLLRRMRRKDEI